MHKSLRCRAAVVAMDVRAIIITGVAGESIDHSAFDPDSSETFSGVPYALLPVLGRPVLHYAADRLKAAGKMWRMLSFGEPQRMSSIIWLAVEPSWYWSYAWERTRK